MWGILLILLLCYSVWDIRKKSIPILWVVAGLAVALVLGGIENIPGMLPGLVFVLIAFAMKGKMGTADGLILAVIGGMTGITYAIAILTAALVMSFFYSCILIFFCKNGQSYCFPFVPFYLCATMFVYCVMVMSGVKV